MNNEKLSKIITNCLLALIFIFAVISSSRKVISDKDIENRVSHLESITFGSSRCPK